MTESDRRSSKGEAEPKPAPRRRRSIPAASETGAAPAEPVKRTSAKRAKPDRAAGSGNAGDGVPAKPAKRAPRKQADQPRRQQQRAIETKKAILGAALQEFARKGFDAASMRDIADRLGIQHPLITYHYRTKELLWRAVAEHIMAEIQEEMNVLASAVDDARPVDRVRAEFRALLSIQHKYPDFHHFMLNESREKGPRLQWLSHNVLAPVVNSILPDIRRAQATGDLPPGEPVLLHYLLVGMTSILTSVAAEIEAVTGFSLARDGIEEQFFALIDQVMFRRNLADGHDESGAAPQN